MVPSAFVMVESLPLSPSGKVDRRALPAPEDIRDRSEAAFLSPRTGIERKVAAVWQEVLQVEKVGIHDNFFDLGGHSLLMVRVYNKLRGLFDKPVSMLDLFRYPTVAMLASHLEPEQGATPSARKRAGRSEVRRSLAERVSPDVAVIGMAGRFPGASTIDEFWSNLRDGVESIRFFTDEELRAAGVEDATLNDPSYIKARAVLEGAEMFDASFFGFTPREAQVMDPQHRLFLECAWAALESAGIDSERYEGLIGVYSGVGLNRYLLMNLFFNREVMESRGGFQLMLGHEKDFLPTRVSYKLNLRGPSLSVQTACSTSLVAVLLACQSLLTGECDIALAGGVSIGVSQTTGYHYQEGGIWSSDGHCRAFDARSSGTVCSSGAGIVVLKRLDDALADGENILAVIKGSAVNNDGSLKVGYTAPSVEGQAQDRRGAECRRG
jgi:3-oxoacyl-(acyl-carrier-protein) synthase/acyl carrier protein